MTSGQATDQNKATYRRFLDANNTGDMAVFSKLIDEAVDRDVLFHAPVEVGATGVEAVKRVAATLHRAFPDLHITADDIIAENDRVVARQTVSGTHQGEYMGLSVTGKSVRYNEIFIFRFVDGRIAEVWGVVDLLSLMKQLEMTDPGTNP